MSELLSCEREKALIEEHMRPWIFRFCDAGEQATSVPFWNSAFELLRCFIEDEMRRLVSKL